MADEVTGTSPETAPGPPPGTPPGTPTRKPRGKQLAILLIGGPILAFGGCALFLSTLNINGHDDSGVQTVLFATMFLAGIGMFLIGCLIAVAVVVQGIYNAHAKKSGDS